MKVFVYGTLKHGYGNHHVLEGSRFVGKGCTVSMCCLYDAGFPVLRERGDAEVWGEVYEVTNPDTLRRLDALEGEGRMYHRRVKLIQLETGKVIKAHTYIGDTKFWSHRRLKPWPLINGHTRPCYHWHRERQQWSAE